MSTRPLTKKVKSDAIVSVFTRDRAVAARAFRFYENYRESIAFECPFCESDDRCDSSSYAKNGDDFEDAYVCNACDTLITIITPNDGREYWAYSPCETRYEIEFMFPDRPTTWPDLEVAEDFSWRPYQPLEAYLIPPDQLPLPFDWSRTP